MRNCVFIIFLHLAVQLHAQFAYKDTLFTNYFKRKTGWTAGDATISLPLGNGKIAWLFGDSYLDNVDANNNLPCLFQLRNCLVVQDSINQSKFDTYFDSSNTGINRTPFKLVKNDTTVFWPGAGWVQHDTAFIFFSRFSNSKLNNLGTYVARWKISKMKLIDLNFLSFIPLNLIFGAAIVRDDSAKVFYIYGTKKRSIVLDMVVAKCKINNIYSPWEYCTGNDSWSIDASKIKPISSGTVSPSFSVFKHKNKCILITQENGFLTCGLGQNIYSETSLKPHGIFGNRKSLYHISDSFNYQPLVTYNAQAHPEFDKNNELLISYNLNDNVDTLLPYLCPSQCKNATTAKRNAYTYRPQFIRIPYAAIDPTFVNNESLKEPITVQIFPNPSSAFFNINIDPEILPNINNSIQIFDMNGKLIFLQNGVQKKQRIVCPKPGFYIIFVQINGNISASKLIVQSE